VMNEMVVVVQKQQPPKPCSFIYNRAPAPACRQAGEGVALRVAETNRDGRDRSGCRFRPILRTRARCQNQFVQQCICSNVYRRAVPAPARRAGACGSGAYDASATRQV
jgi:hypothetical protein